MLGMMLVEHLLSKSFDDIIDVEYTRNLEEDLDKIEQGKIDYSRRSASFYKKFEKDLERAGEGDAQPQGRDRDRSGQSRATSAASRW